MIRIHNMLLAAALASAIALPCAAESLSLADLADAQDAQMIDMDAQDGAWTYPIPYDLLMTSLPKDQLRSDPDARGCRAGALGHVRRGEGGRRYALRPFRLSQLSHAKNHVFQPPEAE